jgi:FdhD protein
LSRLSHWVNLSRVGSEKNVGAGSSPSELAEADAPELDGLVTTASAMHLRDGAVTLSRDWLAVEEPLEIQIGTVPWVVVMRTPGHDAELARGLLHGEGIVTRDDQVLSLRHCSLAESPDAAGNILRARLSPELVVDAAAMQRNLYASASCGLCGKTTIANAMEVAPPLTGSVRIPAERLADMAERMRSRQVGFERTGGLHAAALFGVDGRLHVVREDMGGRCRSPALG